MGNSIQHITEFYPEKSYTNSDFFREFPALKPDEEKLLKVGVTNRFLVDKMTTASDLAFGAAKKMFEQYKINISTIDFLIFCSTEFDHYTPTTSSLLQNRLGLPNEIGAIDIVSSCTGYVHSLAIANGLLESNSCKNILLLAVSTLSKTFYAKDANSKYLFGDAATATLITTDERANFGKFVFGTDGGRGDYIMVKDGGARNPINEESFKEKVNEYGNITCNGNFFMNGSGIFIFGLNTIPRLVDSILEKNKVSFNEIDFFVFHQANEFLLKTLQKKLNIPDEKFIIHMRETGNTVAATIPIALNYLFRSKKTEKGQKILIAAFGTGLTWGGTVITI